MEPAPNDSWNEAFRKRLSGYEPDSVDDRFLWEVIARQEAPAPATPVGQRYVRVGLLAGLLLLIGLTTWIAVDSTPEPSPVNAGRSVPPPTGAMTNETEARSSILRDAEDRSPVADGSATILSKPGTSGKAGLAPTTSIPKALDRTLPSASFGSAALSRRTPRDLAQKARRRSGETTISTPFAPATGLSRRSEADYTLALPARTANPAWSYGADLQPRTTTLGRALRLSRSISYRHQPGKALIQRPALRLYGRVTPLTSFFSFRPDRTDEGVIEGVALTQPNGRMGWQWEGGALLDLPQRQQLRLGLVYQASSPTLLVRHRTGAYLAPTLDGPLQAETTTDTVSLRNRQLGLSAQWLVPLAIGPQTSWYGIGGIAVARALQPGGRTQLSGTFGLGHSRVIDPEGRVRLLIEATVQCGLLMQPAAQLPALSYTTYQTGLSVGLVYELK